MREPDTPDDPPPSRSRLISIKLDEGSIKRSNANVDHEREVAIYDLIDENSFALDGYDNGPYTLVIGVQDDKLVLTVGNEETDGTVVHVLAMSPFRRVIRDYFVVCDSYYQAIRSAPPSRIQAVDMGRRALHDEGSRILVERLQGKVSVDHDTSRRLFTLICALHWKG